METYTLKTAGADLVHDVRGPLPTADGRPPLFMIGQPMDATGFVALAARFPERTVVTYDPRGLGRSVRKDGRTDHTPETQADDVHAVIEALGAGMAAFVAMTSWEGEFTDAYFAQPDPDPAAFGMPTEDDGTRGDPLLSDGSWAISDYRPDVDALVSAATRVVIAVGEESRSVQTGRTSDATAELLGQRVTVFPSHHGGFLDGEFGYPGKPDEFGQRLREVLDAS
ncbi:alpha/beta fold hydrolase [Streptomyces anulatus]|uniref:alpha/beta fold hydrolase n=1 Tax=Streptomyces anulatus TaxID=1892 RepID=UPI00366049C3